MLFITVDDDANGRLYHYAKACTYVLNVVLYTLAVRPGGLPPTSSGGGGYWPWQSSGVYVCNALILWNTWPRKLIICMQVHNQRSNSYVKVIGLRSRSQEQKSLCILFASGLPWTERRSRCCCCRRRRRCCRAGEVGFCAVRFLADELSFLPLAVAGNGNYLKSAVHWMERLWHYVAMESVVYMLSRNWSDWRQLEPPSVYEIQFPRQ